MTTRLDLRRRLRAHRAALDASARRRAAQHMTARLQRLRWWRKARHIALYEPVGAEIDPRGLLQHPGNRDKRFYWPIVQSGERGLVFAPSHARWRRNRYGIAEPAADAHRRVRPAALELVIVPLLGFDAAGNRLGQGGGYYDRTFAFRRNPARIGRPRLVGVAFECQRLDAVDAADWDVPLDAVVTEARTYLR